MLSTSASDNPSRPDPEDHDPGNLDEGEPSSLRGWARILLAVMVWLPKNALSRLAGRFASLQLPGVLQRAEIAAFARLADVNLDEARDPIESYVSLQRFFVRALRDGARPLEGGETSLIAPCDGAWGAAGRVEAGTILQVKGRNYSVAELLGDEERATSYEAGHYATFYLSPRDYHRFHTPTAGRITRVDYRPGALWPVNSIGLNGVDRLFARNERIIAYLDVSTQGSGVGSVHVPPIALIAVGATMVGSVRLSFDDLRTNVVGARPEERRLGDSGPTFSRGQEWGHFEFGSTIVMLTPPTHFEIDWQPIGQPLTLGQEIGRRLSPAPDVQPHP